MIRIAHTRKFNGKEYVANALYLTKNQAVEEKKELKKLGWNIQITQIKPYLGYSYQTWKRPTKGYKSKRSK